MTDVTRYFDIDAMVRNSVKNMHQKGMHYINLHREDDYTVKLYFFDGDVSRLPEVVSPHDHRYSFRTRVVTGSVSNFIFEESPLGEVYNQFDFLTPMLGGNGFTFNRETRLLELERRTYRKGAGYYMGAEEYHTIKIEASGTILELTQYEDEVPVGSPTSTFFRGDAPSLDNGLYESFTADELTMFMCRLPGNYIHDMLNRHFPCVDVTELEAAE